VKRSEEMEKLRTQIKASGGPDRFIDEVEEKQIFDKGRELGIKASTVEAHLNQLCTDNKWTREKEIIEDINDQLIEATKDDGAIDQKEFEHCINYAILLNMPRKRAMQLSVQFVMKEGLKIKKKWLGKDWFEPLKQKYAN